MKPFKYNPNNHSGKFNHRITFQEIVPNSGVNENGFPIDAWQDVKSAWAMIKTLKGSEYFSSSSTQNETESRFVIHYTTGLHPNMRIFYHDRTFNIESIINDDEADKTLTIIVKEAIK
ncbi:MAG: phage head closure protein [Paenisporosarcina sp.]|nr:phage head closure protein [Paenisporosarcina sp.]